MLPIAHSILTGHDGDSLAELSDTDWSKGLGEAGNLILDFFRGAKTMASAQSHQDHALARTLTCQESAPFFRGKHPLCIPPLQKIQISELPQTKNSDNGLHVL